MRLTLLRIDAFVAALSCICLPQALPQGYQRPPKAVTDILDAPPTPIVSISPTRENLLLVERTSYPPIAHLAGPMLRLAGRRINPDTNGPHLAPQNVGLLLQSAVLSFRSRVHGTSEMHDKAFSA